MGAATLTKLWQVANNGGWAESFNFYAGGPGAPDDITGCVATLTLLRPGRPAGEAVTFSSADATSYVTVSNAPAVVTLAIPGTVTLGWAAGVYDVQLRVFGPGSGIDRYNLIGPGRLTVLEAPGS